MELRYSEATTFPFNSIDTATGGAAVIGSGSTFPFNGFAAIDATTAYVTYSDSHASLGLLNHLNASVTTIGPMSSSSLGGLDIASDGNLYGLRYEGEVMHINTSTGAATVIRNTGLGWLALAAIPDQSVPEPGTWMFLALGLVAARACRTRTPKP